MANIRLSNGKILTNVPDDATDDELFQMFTHYGEDPTKYGLAPAKQKEKAGLFSKETLAVPYSQIGNVADTVGTVLLGGAAGLLGANKLQEDIYSGLEARNKQRTEWANPTGKEQTLPAKIVGAIASLPAGGIITGPMGGVEQGRQAMNSGESGGRAALAAGTSVLLNAAANMIPGAPQLAGPLLKAGVGAATNMAADATTSAITKGLMETEGGKEAFDTNLEDLLVSGATGGAFGAMHGKPAPKTRDVGMKAVRDTLAMKAQIKEAEVAKQAAAAKSILDDVIGGKKQKISKDERAQMKQDFPKKPVDTPLPELTDVVPHIPEVEQTPSFGEMRQGLEQTPDMSPIEQPAAPMRNLEEATPLMQRQEAPEGFPVLPDMNKVDQLELGLQDYVPEQAPFNYEGARHFDSPINKELQVIPKEWDKVEMAQRPEVPLPIINERPPVGQRYDLPVGLRKKSQGGWIGGRLGMKDKRHLFDMADEMQKAGANRDDIYTRTGVWYGQDGKARLEHPDPLPESFKYKTLLESAVPSPELQKFFEEASAFKGGEFDEGSPGREIMKRGGRTRPKSRTFNLGDMLLNDDALFNAYPELRNTTIQIEFDPYTKRTTSGMAYPPVSGVHEGKIVLYGNDRNKLFSTLRHEIQHLVQFKEGFTAGSTVKDTTPEAMVAYRNTPGEVEARNVEMRLGLSPLERQMTPPWITEDQPSTTTQLRDTRPLGLRMRAQAGVLDIPQIAQALRDKFSPKQMEQSLPKLYKNDFNRYMNELGGDFTKKELFDAWTLQGGKLPANLLTAKTPKGYEWTARNRSNKFEDNAAAIQYSPDIEVGMLEGLKQGGDQAKRRFNNAAATYLINLIDQARRDANMYETGTRREVIDIFNHVRKVGGVKREHELLTSWARGEDISGTAQGRALAEKMETLYNKLNTAYKADQVARGVSDVKELGKEQFYFPHSQWGAWKQTVRDKYGRQFTISDDNRNNVNKGIKWANENGYKLIGDVEYDSERSFSRYDRDSRSGSPAGLDFLPINEGETTATLSGDLGAHGRLQEREGNMPWWKGNEPWLAESENAQNAGKVFDNYNNAVNNYAHGVEARTELNKYMSSPEAEHQYNLKAWADDYFRSTFGRNQNLLGRASREITSTIGKAIGMTPLGVSGRQVVDSISYAKRGVVAMTLGMFNVPTMLVQAGQGPLAYLSEGARIQAPLPKKIWGGVRGAVDGAIQTAVAIPRLMDHAFLGDRGKNLVSSKALNKELRAVLMVAEKEGIIDSFVTDTLAASPGETKLQRWMEDGAKFTEGSIKFSDQVGRVFFTTAMYSALRHSGHGATMSRDAALGLSQVIMGSTQRHNQMSLVKKSGQLGSSMAHMRSFAANELNNIMYNAKNMFRTKEDFQAFALQMGTTFAIAGAAAMPMMEDTDNMFQVLRNFMAEKFNDASMLDIPSPMELAMDIDPDVWTGPLAASMGFRVGNVGVGGILPSSAAEGIYSLGGRMADIASGAKDVVLGDPTEKLIGANKMLPKGIPMVSEALERGLGQENSDGSYTLPSVSAKGRYNVTYSPEEQNVRKWGMRPTEKAQEGVVSISELRKQQSQKNMLANLRDQVPEMLMKMKLDNKLGGMAGNRVNDMIGKWIDAGGEAEEFLNIVQKAQLNNAVQSNIQMRYQNISATKARDLKAQSRRIKMFNKLKD